MTGPIPSWPRRRAGFSAQDFQHEADELLEGAKAGRLAGGDQLDPSAQPTARALYRFELDDKGSFRLARPCALVLRLRLPVFTGLGAHGSVKCFGESLKSFEFG